MDAEAGVDGGDGGIVSIEINPPTQTLILGEVAGVPAGTATFTLTGHFQDGHTEDVTARASWPSQFHSLQVTNGVANVSAPGVYMVTAVLGSSTVVATLTATFQGNCSATNFDPNLGAVLDGTPVGATQIAYPSDGAILPPNLGPVQVHIARTTPSQSAARITLLVDQLVDVNYYAACQSGAGAGCYVDLPLDLTQLFIAVSESHDVQLIARVGGVGVPLLESSSIKVAWANVPLSGGLYYWSALPPGVLGGYVPPKNADNTPATTGTGILRYDFGVVGSTTPELIYTDQGRPPVFLGSPPATADGSQCVGCHAISNDGKTMALAIGGSGAADLALLNLTTLTMTVLDAAASAGVTSMSDINYYKQFRLSNIATETTFGPNGDVMVNMYKSKLYMRGTNASLVNEGEVAATFVDTYKSDPFWSPSGHYLAFTSFSQPDVGTFNTTGLNGDMKRDGQIAIADVAGTSIANPRVLVPREANVTKYYPAVSNDDMLVVYDQSTCGIDPDVYTNLNSTPVLGIYGSQTCDGYDDSSATMWITTPTGATPIRLDAANGGTQVSFDNASPRWSPGYGIFRGEKLYWLVFSSRRPYGLQVNNGAPLTTSPQLWLAAITVGQLFLDPSRSAVWLPNQNPTAAGAVPNATPSHNHTPRWVTTAVQLPP